MSSAARAERRRLEREAWRPDKEWEAQVSALAEGWPGEPPTCWRKGSLAAIVSRDLLHGESLPRWHVSVAHRDRVPSWEELSAAGHELRPGVVFAIGVPPRSWWVNVHEHALHLWELRDEALIESWRFERRGDEPS